MQKIDSIVFTLIMRTAILSLLLLLGSCCPQKFSPCQCPPPLGEVCYTRKPRIALVLGSGGVRGMAHVGVLEVFEEAGIPFDIIVGCSAGSLVGALYADNPDSEAVKCALSKLKTNSILDINLFECRFGLSQGTSFKRVLKNNLHSRCFEDLQIPFVLVATDLWSGELIPIGRGDIVESVRASCSIPFVFVPVAINGRVLVDGGCINPVPVVVARDLGAEFVIAVDLCELLPTTFPTNLFGVAKRSTEIAFLWQSDRCTTGADVVIRPRMCQVGTFDDSKKDVLLTAGREAAIAALPQICEALERLGAPPENEECHQVILRPYNTHTISNF